MNSDFRDLLAEFARFGVEYALLGGYAVGFHGKPRATKDRADVALLERVRNRIS